jgi:hypothetical protein
MDRRLLRLCAARSHNRREETAMSVFPTVGATHAPESHLQPARLSIATHDEAQQAVRAAREMFGRTLACWTGDLLMLRARGLHAATWTDQARRRRLRRAA